jgi:hypothetical protein
VEEISARARSIIQRFDGLASASSVKMARIQAALEIEQSKEDARYFILLKIKLRLSILSLNPRTFIQFDVG